MQAIPTEKLDLLVAGTSCVDFSSLNNKKDDKTKVNAFDSFSKEDLTGEEDKISIGLDHRFQQAVHEQLSPEGLGGIGESMTTFLSTLNFIMERRPRIVIFENVQTAPWKSMQNFWLPRAGYAAEFVKVDTKKYYLPQDRIRGYLVALDAQEFDRSGSWSKSAELVKDIMLRLRGLEQQTTASVLDFLLDDDDPNVLQARDEIARHGVHGMPKETRRTNSDRQIDWDFCKIRHMIYSQRWNLDTVRRFSKATLSHGRVTSASPPARSWIEYWAHETPRIIDLFDNMYQQFLTRAGCDMNYKAALFNISQNLDRMPVCIAKLGIAPIITPAGMPTLSYLGRPLLGVECLVLQGIPKNRLRLSGESHRELRDLAGNAMTVTVIGATILATLMAAGPDLVHIHRALQRTQPVTSSSYVELVEDDLKEIPSWDFGDFRLDVSSLQAYGGFRVCRCPLVGSHNRIIYRCRDCGKMACQLCRANPPHSFEHYNYATPVNDVADLKIHIQQGLPGVFNLKMQGGNPFFGMWMRGVKQKKRDAMRRVLSNNEFYFSGVKVYLASIIVEYRSRGSIARLALRRTGGAAWYIFESSEALGVSPVGVHERGRRAIAKASLDEQQSTVDPEAAVWFAWEPIKHSWLATVSVKKDHCFVLDEVNMESGSSPPSHLEAHIRRSIRGAWFAHPQCGTPEDSMYIRRGPETSETAFLFKDVNPIGHPTDDMFIISRDVELAETQERRGDEVTLKLYDLSNIAKTVKISVPGYWQPMEPMGCFQTSIHKTRLEDRLYLASCATIAGSATKSCCAETPLTIIKLSVRLNHLAVSPWARHRWSDRWYDVPAIDFDEFFGSILFTANALDQGPFFKPDSGLSFDPDHGIPVKLCPDCCVEPPKLHWVKGKIHIVPWEDPDQVRAYEEKVMAMPEPFTARVRLDPMFPPPRELKDKDSDDVYPDLGLLLAVNPRTLASRAAANLAYGFRPREYSPVILSDVQCSFQVEIGGLLGPNVRFVRFYDSIPTTDDETGVAHIEPAGNLSIPSFERKGHRLREDQAQSVQWMRAREEAPAPYLETEVEEQVFDAFNMRIVGRAAYPNDGSAFCCRGGIIAHEIGYGKTVVMIALMELRRDYDRTLSMVKRCEAALNYWESALSFIHLKATLVIVPDHITLQWHDEFGKFGCNATILVINRYADLPKTPLSALEKADVIIMAASIFRSAAYKTSLNLLMEDRPTGSTSDREAEDRYRASLGTIRKVVTRYRELPGNLSNAGKEAGALDKAKEVLASINEEYQALCQKWEFVGGRKAANKQRRQGKKPSVEDPTKAKKAARAKPLWTATRFVENFSFARIIVDEFSYDNPSVTSFVTNSLANAKWLLSGTPRCDNLSDIVHMGRLLSVHIARPDRCIPTYLDPITRGPRINPTALTEEYRLRAAHSRSHNFALERHHSAENFIQHFVRQDKVNMTNFELETKKVESELPMLSRIVYGGLQHDLAVAQGNIFNLPFALRRALEVHTTCSYVGDNVDIGTKAADSMMAKFASMPMTAGTLKSFVGSSDVDVQHLKKEIKVAMDKLVWLSHRQCLVATEIRDKYPRHHQIRTLIEDIFAAMADARDSWIKGPMAQYGGKDAYLQLAKAICPSTVFRYQDGGLESWTEWRYIEAKTFWPDWYDLPDSYIDDLASPEKRGELVELSADVILLNISHPLGRSFARYGGDAWLDSHAIALGRILDERMSGTFLDIRQASAAEMARAAAVRDTVPKFSTERLIKFLKDCMKEKLQSFDPNGVTKHMIAERGKDALLNYCHRRNLRVANSTSALQLGEKILNYLTGHFTKRDFIDRRGVIPPRAEFPIPNQIFDRRGGKTEATLEEMTLTYSYLLSCREAWIHAFRRHRLYTLLRYIRFCHNEGEVERYCGACLRRPVCEGNVPAFLVLVCGHFLCEEHNRMLNKDDKNPYFCPVQGCGAIFGLSNPITVKLTERDILDGDDIWEAEGEARCAQGGKVPGIVSLIEGIPEDDKVVLFTSIEELAVSVRDKLAQAGVSVLSMVSAGSDADPADTLEDFKKGKAKVFIIDPTAEHAAGSNLTIANHVIFASPLLDRDEFLRKMHYRQAIGRCVREGQTKKVTVYTFVTKGTIDEELYNVCDIDSVMEPAGH